MAMKIVKKKIHVSGKMCACVCVCVCVWCVHRNRYAKSLSCARFCDSMNFSTLGIPVHHQLPEFT